MQKFLSDLIKVFVLAVVAGASAAHGQYGPVQQPLGGQLPQNNSYNISPGVANQFGAGTGTKHTVPGNTIQGNTTQGSTSRGQTGAGGWGRVNNVGSGTTNQGNTGQTQAGTNGWNRTRNVGSGTTTQGSTGRTQTSTPGWDLKQNKAQTQQSNTQGLGQIHQNQALVQQGSTTRGQMVGGTARPQSNLISGSRSTGQTQTGDGLTRAQNTSVQAETRHVTAAPPHRGH